MNRLRTFTQFHIFINITKEVEPAYEFILSIEDYNNNSTLNIFYIFAYYVYFVHLCTLKFSINA